MSIITRIRDDVQSRWRRSRAQMGRLKYCLPETSPFFSGAPYMDSVYERTENAQNMPPWTVFAIYTVVEAVGCGEFDSCSIRPDRDITDITRDKANAGGCSDTLFLSWSRDGISRYQLKLSVDLGEERDLNAEKNETGHTVSHNSQRKWKCKCA
jgi:hypothetical protein